VLLTLATGRRLLTQPLLLLSCLLLLRRLLGRTLLLPLRAVVCLGIENTKRRLLILLLSTVKLLSLMLHHSYTITVMHSREIRNKLKNNLNFLDRNIKKQTPTLMSASCDLISSNNGETILVNSLLTASLKIGLLKMLMPCLRGETNILITRFLRTTLNFKLN